MGCVKMKHINHTTGYKDDYRVEVDVDGPWHPRNDELFELADLWFEAEDHEFGDGYGRWMPWFYFSLVALGEKEKAMNAHGKEGFEAMQYFEELVDEHGDELIEEIEKLKWFK